MITYMVLSLIGATTEFYLKLPVGESSVSLRLPLTGTEFGVPLGVPVIRSMVYFDVLFTFDLNQ